MQTVIKIDSKQMARLIRHYQPFQKASAPTGARLAAVHHGVTVTAYQSGKVMFQGADSQKEASQWTSSLQGSSTSSAASTKSLPKGFNRWSVLGSDEVGAGAYFGPLTTAAVFVSQENLNWVSDLGIMDSKVLTDEKIQAIGPAIIKNLPHHVVNLMPQKYNQLQKQYNVVALKALSHNFALKQVLKKINPDEVQGILIDQFAQESTFNRYVKAAHQTGIDQPKTYFTTKGERYHLSVAAASILARYVELDAMKQLSQQAGMKLPIGAGKQVDQVAAKLIRQGLPLNQFAKLHFANTQKAEAIAQSF